MWKGTALDDDTYTSIAQRPVNRQKLLFTKFISTDPAYRAHTTEGRITQTQADYQMYGLQKDRGTGDLKPWRAHTMEHDRPEEFTMINEPRQSDARNKMVQFMDATLVSEYIRSSTAPQYQEPLTIEQQG